jgi:hypothetical protein
LIIQWDAGLGTIRISVNSATKCPPLEAETGHRAGYGVAGGATNPQRHWRSVELLWLALW